MDAHSATLPAAAMPANGLGRFAGHLDSGLGRLVETVAANPQIPLPAVTRKRLAELKAVQPSA